MNNGRTISLSLSAIAFILGVVFLVLKLCKVITWSWLVVCIPFIVLGAIAVLTIILIVILILFSID